MSDKLSNLTNVTTIAGTDEFYVVAGGNSRAITAADLATAIDALLGGGSTDAIDVAYDNITSGLTAADVQAALDEIAGQLGVTSAEIVAALGYTPADAAALATVATTGAYSDLTGTPGNATPTVAGLMSAADKAKTDGIEAGATADQTAAEVPYSNTTSGLTATDVQAAIDEVAASGGGGAVDSVNGQTGAVVLAASDVGASADDHTHGASEIAYNDGPTGLGVSDVQSAIEYLADSINGEAFDLVADWSAWDGSLDSATTETPLNKHNQTRAVAIDDSHLLVIESNDGASGANAHIFEVGSGALITPAVATVALSVPASLHQTSPIVEIETGRFGVVYTSYNGSNYDLYFAVLAADPAAATLSAELEQILFTATDGAPSGPVLGVFAGQIAVGYFANSVNVPRAAMFAFDASALTISLVEEIDLQNASKHCNSFAFGGTQIGADALLLSWNDHDLDVYNAEILKPTATGFNRMGVHTFSSGFLAHSIGYPLYPIVDQTAGHVVMVHRRTNGSGYNDAKVLGFDLASGGITELGQQLDINDGSNTPVIDRDLIGVSESEFLLIGGASYTTTQLAGWYFEYDSATQSLSAGVSNPVQINPVDPRWVAVAQISTGRIGVFYDDGATTGSDFAILQAPTDQVASDSATQASEVVYDNAASGMTATTAQAAIDELDGRVDTLEGAGGGGGGTGSTIAFSFTASGAVGAMAPVALNADGTVAQVAQTTTPISAAGTKEQPAGYGASTESPTIRYVQTTYSGSYWLGVHHGNNASDLMAFTADADGQLTLVGTTDLKGSSGIPDEGGTNQFPTSHDFAYNADADTWICAFSLGNDFYVAPVTVDYVAYTWTPDYASRVHIETCTYFARPRIEYVMNNDFVIAYSDAQTNSGTIYKYVFATYDGVSAPVVSTVTTLHTCSVTSGANEVPPALRVAGSTVWIAFSARDEFTRYLHFDYASGPALTEMSRYDDTGNASSWSQPTIAYDDNFTLFGANLSDIQDENILRGFAAFDLTTVKASLSVNGYAIPLQLGTTAQDSAMAYSVDMNNGDTAEALSISLSGGVLSTGTPVTIVGGTTTTEYGVTRQNAGAWMPTNGRFMIIAWRAATSDDPNFPDVSWQLIDAGGTSTNVTDYVGVAPAAIADAASGNIALSGVIDGFTGLTVGERYYVDANGGLVTFWSNEHEFIGRAISSTAILMRPSAVA